MSTSKILKKLTKQNYIYTRYFGKLILGTVKQEKYEETLSINISNDCFDYITFDGRNGASCNLYFKEYNKTWSFKKKVKWSE